MTKKLLALGLSLTMALSLAACGGDSSSAASTSGSNTDASTSQSDASTGDASTAAPTVEKLVLGTSADYPPFEFHILDENGEDKIVGIDVFLGEQIAEVVKDASTCRFDLRRVRKAVHKTRRIAEIRG